MPKGTLQQYSTSNIILFGTAVQQMLLNWEKKKKEWEIAL